MEFEAGCEDCCEDRGSGVWEEWGDVEIRQIKVMGGYEL